MRRRGAELGKQLVALLLFLALAFGLAYLIDFLALVPALQRHDKVATLILGVVRMYTPFLGTIAALKVLGLSIKKGLVRYGLRGGLAEYIIPGILAPYALYGISIAIGLAIGMRITNPVEVLGTLGAKLPVSGIPALIILIASAVINGSTINTLAAIGEEMGWRGFLLGELGPRLGLYPAAIVIGAIWGLWHAPLILLAGYNYPHHPDLTGLAMFVAICIAWSAVLCQLRVLGKSILPPSFAHGNLNAVAGMILLTFKGDEIYTAPLGLLGLAALTIMEVVIGILARGRIERVELYESSEEIFTNIEY